VAFLREKLRPVGSVPAEQLAALLAGLDHPERTRRDQAAARLRDLGGGAAAAIQKELQGKPSPEARWRLTQLLEQLEPSCLARAIDVLDDSGTPGAGNCWPYWQRGKPKPQ
jgi:hypothetical protein